MQAYMMSVTTGPHMDRDRIGQLVLARRKTLRLSLRDAAPRTASPKQDAISFTTWGQVENGTLNWSADTLERILKALDAHLEVELRPGTDAQPLDPVRRELLDRLSAEVDQLPDEAVRSLLAQLAVYAASRGTQGNNSR